MQDSGPRRRNIEEASRSGVQAKSSASKKTNPTLFVASLQLSHPTSCPLFTSAFQGQKKKGEVTAVVADDLGIQCRAESNRSCMRCV